MSVDVLTLATDISGTINGVKFNCSGTGYSEIGSGEVESSLKFTNWPGISPFAYGQSWKCSGHKKPSISKQPGAVNPFATILDSGASIYTTEEHVYPNGYGVILAGNRIFMRDATTQAVEGTRLGTYTGPDNITRVLPHTETVRPSAPGKAIGECTRQMVTGEGELVSITRMTTYLYPEEFEIPPVTLYYDGDMIWKDEELTLSIFMRVSFELLDF